MNWKGQSWLSREEFAKTHKLVWRDDLGLPGIAVEPGFAIAQRALLVREPDGCVLWDCVPLVTSGAVEYVKSLGGLKAIAVSHPHFYGAIADWSEAFGGVPIYLHADDRQWVTRPHPAIVFWRGESHLALRRYCAGSHRRAFCRRHHPALAPGRRRPRRPADRRRRHGGDGSPLPEFHVQLSEPTFP